MTNLLIILDTNFLMVPELYGVDIFSELDRIVDKKYELIVPEVVIGELKNIKKNGDLKEGKAAGVGLDLSTKAKKAKSEKSADEEILRLAQEKKNSAVATNDSQLQKRLKEKGIPIIFLRQKSHLESDRKI